MDRLDILKEKVKEILPEVDFVIGYSKGFDILHPSPYFVSEERQIRNLIWDEFCINNFANYLPPPKRVPNGLFKQDEKIGLVVKGCDSRSIIQLLQEEIIFRDTFIILGMPCEMKIDLKKLREKIDIDYIQSFNVSGDKAEVKTLLEKKTINLDEILYDKCLYCKYPNPLIYDYLIGDKVNPRSREGFYKDVDEFEMISNEEKISCWEKEFDRCIRCYACREACPNCYCQYQCIAQTRRPHWISQSTETIDKKFFQMFRAFHNAGRCTDCGECDRVCPVGIPISKIMKKLTKEVLRLFNYEAGVDEKLIPPLMTYKREEDNIG
ncbi:MAG: 4Fe-4S dicluster domain-containing protein [Actinobacteria bacterium]|nr:4Fe-4S dicluster domain-containing protein [Actinomycetota bacterium]